MTFSLAPDDSHPASGTVFRVWNHAEASGRDPIRTTDAGADFRTGHFMLNRERVPIVSVCDRIEELAAHIAEQTPKLPETLEVGILAAVEREVCAECESGWGTSWWTAPISR